MMSAAVAGTTFRPISSYTTLRDVTVAADRRRPAASNKTTGSMTPPSVDNAATIPPGTESVMSAFASMQILVGTMGPDRRHGLRPDRR